MDAIFADRSVSISELKRNPGAVIKSAGGRPVAVLNHNKAPFSMTSPELMAQMAELLEDQHLARIVAARRGEFKDAVTVSLDEL